MIEAIILKYWHIWCVIAYCFMFATRKCKNNVTAHRTAKIKGKWSTKHGYKPSDSWQSDWKQRLQGTHRGEIYWKAYLWWTQMNASEMLKWTFLYYDFILSDNLTACCSIGLKHNLLLIFFSIDLLKLRHNCSYIWDRKKEREDRQAVTSCKSNMKQLKSADLTYHKIILVINVGFLVTNS